PQTDDESFNHFITKYIKASKKSYIKAMRLKQNIDKKNTVPGELNIHFDTYQYNEKYYSFVFTNRMSANDNDLTTSIKTVFYNIESKEILDIQSLLGEDDKNLETFVTHVRSVIEANKELQPVLLKEDMLLATEARWILFDKFAIHDDELVIYFDEGSIAKKEYGPVSITIPLSFLNPILAAEFQIEMVAEENPGNVIDDNRKRVALTFDDGPHPKVTMQILQSLEKYNAKATFFMLGNRVQYYPEIAKEVHNRGHELGNHSWSHPVLPKLSKAQIMGEFTTTEEAIFASTGHESTVFRPPYGATNAAINEMIPRHVVNWTVDTLDWKHRDQHKLLPIVQNGMHNNAIILMHDIHQSTADGLDAVLAYLSSEGYEFVTVSEILPYR
uniref:polysaccharide deacetylase family protein n=1 Tax=Lysinibacillus sp. 54212 TaxID=3119829 RepID=UPI002FC7DA50